MYRYVLYIYGPAAQQPRIRRIPHVGGLARYLHTGRGSYTLHTAYMLPICSNHDHQDGGLLQGRQLWPFSATTTGNSGRIVETDVQS